LAPKKNKELKMKKYALFGLIGAVFLTLPFLHAGNKKSAKSDKKETISLSARNTISLRMPVTGSSVAPLQQEIYALSAKLAPTETIYFVLNTPGGSIEDGLDLVQTMKSIPQEIKTITGFAASMGFVIVQNGGERLVLPNGVLMQHRARGGFDGQIPGELNSRTDFYTDRVKEIEEVEAVRMGISHEEYAKLVINEYWTAGGRAVQENAADRIVKASCDATLVNGVKKEVINTMFGPVEVEWSNCPLVASPLSIKFGDNYDTTRDYLRMKEAVTQVLRSPRIFATDRDTRATYERFVF
jgi:ATP-dependent protease ClpP protease subunit